MKKFEVSWLEKREFKCTVEVEAETENEAYDKASEVDYPDREEETNKTPDFDRYLNCREKP